MAHLIGKPAIMVLSCLLVVVLSAAYPVAAVQAGEQARLATGKEAGAVTSGLPQVELNDSQLQVPNLRLRKVILSNSPTLPLGSCSGKDISIAQHPSGSSAAGISEFKVEIFNNCNSGCPPSNIHVNCGEFASAELVNPDTFKRVAVNDCLVNGGKALPYGTVLSFTYANSHMYSLSFKSATFC